MTTSESKGRFFLQNESIRIDSHNELNRIDSNRELECSMVDSVGLKSILCSSLSPIDVSNPTFTNANVSVFDFGYYFRRGVFIISL